MKRLALALLITACGAAEHEPLPEPVYDFGCPNESSLACTGLYGPVGEHWYSKRLGSGVEPFTPAAALWSDHMHKQRYVWLPPGSTIDTTDPDDWTFPVGTKLWKEFSYEGKRIETRLLEKRNYEWRAATYRWTEDEMDALSITEGERNVPGTFEDRYEVPAVRDCRRCHQGARDQVLGFSAVLLAGADAQGLTLQKLQQTAKLSTSPPALQVPGTPVDQAALSYLHVNCGVACHNPSWNAEAWWTGFYLKLDARDLTQVSETAAHRTGVGQDSYIVDPARPDRYLKLIAPGEPERSAVVYRDGERGSEMQMPPLATHSVDEAGLAAVKAWISSLPATRPTP
ncbi:MAG: hypothetical protein EOO73_21880 [Myxococcales bacterium]|nr:MAG: hypothetical protein EOO73_21880 [Myxococcales bacterium]